MKKLIPFFVLFFAVHSSYSQDNLFNPINNIAKIPQSPEAAAFEKFSGSVNMYSGVPTIGIPLYTLQGREISVPISLSYDASGIKVDQIATNIGLGWNLNYGGVITRNVNGHPDDYISDGGGHPSKKIIDFNTREYLDYLMVSNTNIHGNQTNASLAKGAYDEYQQNNVDLQPDTFSFVVNGLSGTILIDYGATPVKAYCIDNPGIKIELDGGPQNDIRFIITDTNGTRYEFAKEETTEHTTSPVDFGLGGTDEYVREYVTAWYLSRIQSVNGLDAFEYHYTIDEWVDEELTAELQQVEIQEFCGGGTNTQSPLKNLGYDKYIKNQVILDRISYNGNEVLKAITQTGRSDLSGVKKIIGLDIFNRTHDILLNIDFDNPSYFGDLASQSTMAKRLKLDGLKIYRDDVTDAKEYIFEYDSEALVPVRKSPTSDFWGYYNGIANTHLAPNPNLNYDDIARWYPDITQGITFTGYQGADRRPNLINTKIGSLVSITYPTGGKSTYHYEQHKDNNGDVVGGLRLEKVVNETLDPIANENDELVTYYFYDDLKAVVDDTSNSFTIPENPGDLSSAYSSGIAQQELTFNEIKSFDDPGNCGEKYFLLTRNLGVIVPQAITYSAVTEIRFNKASSGSQFEGCTVTEFYNGEYENTSGKADSQKPFKNEKLEYGSLKYQKVYDKDLTLLQQTYTEYVTESVTNSPLSDKVGLIVYQKNKDGEPATIGGSEGCYRIRNLGGGTYEYYNYYNQGSTCLLSDSQYLGLGASYSHYFHTPGYGYAHIWNKMLSSKTTTYENGQPLEIETTYAYNGANHYFPTQTITTDSKGGFVKSNTLYPSDSGQLIGYPSAGLGFLQDMVTRNQLNIPIQVTTSYTKGNLLTGVYEEISQQRQIFNDFTPTSGYPIGFNLLKPSIIEVSKGSYDLEERVIFRNYDTYGNLTEVSYPPVPAMRHMYIWGYNGEHLLAEIKNASYFGISTPLQNTITNIIAYSDGENNQIVNGENEEETLRNDLNDLRNESHFDDAQLSVFTYDPGVGITSTSDVRNYTNFYFYDQHNRLSYATDQDGMVLGKNEYKFRVNTTATENSIKTTTYQDSFVIAQINNGTPLDNEKLESITYSDGMGRAKQNIGIRAGGSRENIIQYIEYDDLGRETKQYLPYASSNSGSAYIPLATASSGTSNFYNTAKYGNTTNPYTESILEKSPRSRLLETGAPGDAWEADAFSNSDRTIKAEYALNNASEVMRFSVTYASQGSDPQLVYENYYLAKELTKVTTKDENWQPSDGNNNLTQTFTNKNGQVLLKRQRVYNPLLSTDQTYRVNTYYIYDDFGNLVYVLSPEGSDKVVVSGVLVSNYQTFLDQYCYQYKYDDRNRMIEKKLPGRGEEYVFYDALDRPVLTQDAIQRASDEFLFTKYDTFDRVVYTGIYTSPDTNPSRTDIESDIASSALYESRTINPVNIDGTNVYYTKAVFPASNVEVLTVAYYDDYIDTANVGSPPSSSSYGETITSYTEGLPTVSKVRVLHDNTTEDWITTVSGFDEKARLIYIKSENPYLDKTNLSESQLDFASKVLESTSVHYDDSGNNADITIIDYFNYDHIGRPLTHEQKIDDSPVQLISANIYDDMGQLLQKNVGGETYVDGYTDMVNVDVAADQTIENIATSAGWNGYLKTRGEVLSEGGVSFKALDSDKEIKVGFFKVSQTQVPTDYLHYGIYLTDDGLGAKEVKYVVNGTVYSPSPTVTYTANDTFKVERVEVTNGVYKIEFSKNSQTPFVTITANVTADPLIGKAVFYDPGAKITNFELVGNDIDKILQEIDYKYNVRGWMTDVNNVDGASTPGNTDLFNFRINYNKTVVGTASAPSLYNGNISQTVWMSTIDDTKRSYAYEYDQLNRLIDATGRKGSSLNTSTDFNVANISYDKNGNIQTLRRYGEDPNSTFPLIWDDLSYAYSGNQLQGVGETGSYTDGFRGDSAFPQTSYNYDVNGNMTSDSYKGITNITYNHLDLPETISISNGSQSGTISYLYDATGVKLEKKKVEGSTTDRTYYAGGFVYKEATLEFIAQPEGYIMPVSATNGSVTGFDKGSNTITYSSYDYVFQYVDHLGNIRLSYSDKGKDGSIDSGDIIEESNYYPFGLKHLGYNDVVYGGNDLAQAWKFGGKELNAELGLDWYDITARNYDPALGRWMNIDPLAELMRRHSPYNYAFDNPIFFIDPDGMTPTPHAVSAAQSGNFASIGSAISFSSTTDVNSLAEGTTIIDAGGGGTVISSGNSSGDSSNSQQSDTSSPLAIGLSDDNAEGTKLQSGGKMVIGVNGVSLLEDDRTKPSSIKFSPIGSLRLSQTAAVSGIDKLLYNFGTDEGGSVSFAYFITVVPYYFNLPTLTGNTKIDSRMASIIAADAIDHGFSKLQDLFDRNNGNFDTNKADSKFRGYINNYLKKFGGSVSTTPTLGFKGEISIHSETMF